MVLVMRLQIREKEEKRLLGLRLVIDVTDGGIGLSIDAIARKLHLVVILIPEMGVVGAGNKLQQIGGQPIIIASSPLFRHRPLTLVRHQMPFTNVPGVISCLREAGTQHF